MKKSALIAMMMILSLCGASQAGILIRGKIPSPNDSDYVEPKESASPTGRAVLPKRGDIAVLVNGSNKQHVAIAEAMIVEELASRGYRVVDEAKMKRIKAAAARSKAAIYALEGNVAGILSLNAHYSAAATIVARVEADYPRLNEFQVYSGTASVALLAVTSGGKKLGGRTSDAHAIAYTIAETQRNALKQAVNEGMQQLF